MEFLGYLTDGNVITFLLLLLRFSAILTFFPFFDSQLVPVSVRGAMAFFLTLLFLPLAHTDAHITTLPDLLFAAFMEIALGFMASVALQIVFSAMSIAGDSISFSMGMTMASAYDPASSNTRPIIAQAIILSALILALMLNFHHLIFQFVAYTLEILPLGEVSFSSQLPAYLIRAFGSMFALGFAMAFPVLGMILLADIVFGMIMKTHSQFNLFSFGFPLKIGIAMSVIILIIPGILYHFKTDLYEAFRALSVIFRPQ
ncbi:flagellar biosynthetic protein FliR [Helicobacter sp. CLO-3]|uniref:flagellar biosynthetic protein FliR n=1 Tax=unclassified Helicobacter TaxID=2593540 RepID=UPI0008051228|nr:MULTISPECIES: flagellar biosynthetic protein FliR [unclassified Helicobacter]OBV28570.1 flagellar biosynthetic protein FliR [Helicobacter sp. CLO-3]OHU81164.1 flagellar biosynthetic protein FliR [Helicobacter sp. CLO-3]